MNNQIKEILVKLNSENDSILLELDRLDSAYESLAKYRAYEFKIRLLENALQEKSQEIQALETKIHLIYTGKRFRLGHIIISFIRKILFLK